MTKSGEDPVATAQLKPEQVDGPGIGALVREGFLQGYMYLTAGSYNIVEASDKQVAQVLGGTLSTVSGADAHNEECGGDANTSYSVVAAVADGAAFSVPADGWYVVAYDQTLSEIIFDQLVTVGIIGDATPGGWGADTELTTTVTSDGVSASIEGVTLDEAQMKFRFNCRWAIDRRLDKNQDFSNANGYSFWTNYGGTIDALVPGNIAGNIAVPEYAVYTVTFAWDATNGATATLTKTGEAEPKPEYPAAMYLVGAGTAYGWDTPGTVDNGIMHKVGNSNDGLFWKILHIEAGQGFKISAENWNAPNLGFGDVTEYDAEGVTVSDNGGNMDISESGMYTVVLDLRNDMKKVSIKPAEVYGIGEAFPTTPAWTAGAAENKFTVDNVNKTIVSPELRADANIRSYVSHAWLVDWWTAEFVPNAGSIEYRNDSGSDPSAVPGLTGDVITYFFDTNTSAID
jgi:hypothetical protein